VYFTQDYDDTAAVRRCLTGDTAAYEVLVSRYQGVLFGVARRMLGNHADAHDATQNAFVKAFEQLASYDPGRRFFSWIYRILINECLNMLRARRPQEPVVPGMALAAGPLESLEAAERGQIVRAALKELAPDYREVIVLRHFGGLSYDEIAQTIGVPARTVKSRLYTARRQLGERLFAWSPTR
jgi:RNA polymerase sigma-70 factor (ECF subfamily)